MFSISFVLKIGTIPKIFGNAVKLQPHGPNPNQPALNLRNLAVGRDSNTKDLAGLSLLLVRDRWER